MRDDGHRARGAAVIAILAIAAITRFENVAVADSADNFYAYYTKVSSGAEFERFSRTGDYADVIVKLSEAGGQLVFWRGNSYLPYWKTDAGRWDLTEIIPRSGDGAAPMPDRANVYAHAEIIEATRSRVVVHWRYLQHFTPGNPHGEVDSNQFVDETFSISPGGRVVRVIKPGTKTIDEWKDASNQTVQVLRLTRDGVAEISRTNPGRSRKSAKADGRPVKAGSSMAPSVWFRFDEATGDVTKESISGTGITVPGHKTLWKRGVSGTALEFDGYHTVVSLPAAQAPMILGGSLTLEGWFALGAYPWDWTPIVQQGDDDGYFLGVDSHGYPGFKLKVDGVWQQLTISNRPPYTDANHLALFRWYHLAGTYDRTKGMMRLYLDGREIANQAAGQGGAQPVKADLRVGKAGIFRVPTEGTHDTLPSEFGLDGLIDEVKLYNVALDANQVAESYRSLKPVPAGADAPDMERRHFPLPATEGKFGAVYTHLPYYETWENLWRFGPYADVVVAFDQLPTKFVFWRGVSFIPMMVNESNQWFTEEFNETGFTTDAPGDCEPMSDKPCLDSHVRVIENTAARAVVHWRYRLANPSHHWANYDPRTGWGDIADWYFYIYPDGVASVDMRCYRSKPSDWLEWDEQIAVFSPGQRPESVLRKAPVMTLVNRSGQPKDYDWDPSPPNPHYGDNLIQMIHFTGRYSPFAIQNFDGGDTYSGERTWYSAFPTWNHWPISQINSSGRNASFPDRASHSSISHLFWPLHSERHGDIPFQEKMLMEGMTDRSAVTLTNLAASWLRAPALEPKADCRSLGTARPTRVPAFGLGSLALVPHRGLRRTSLGQSVLRGEELEPR